MTAVLACDLGSTSLRVAVVGEDGQVRHAVSAAGEPEAVEIDPQIWRESFTAAVDRLAASAGAGFDAVEAVAISSLTRTQVLKTPVGPAVHGMLTRPRPGGLGTSGHPMHDPCVIGWLLWPELFGGRPARSISRPRRAPCAGAAR